MFSLENENAEDIQINSRSYEEKIIVEVVLLISWRIKNVTQTLVSTPVLKSHECLIQTSAQKMSLPKCEHLCKLSIYVMWAFMECLCTTINIQYQCTCTVIINGLISVTSFNCSFSTDS